MTFNCRVGCVLMKLVLKFAYLRSGLQKTMLGEFTSIYTFGFYVGASILSYILTSTPRTASARIWLFVFLTLNFITEKIVVSHHLGKTRHVKCFGAQLLSIQNIRSCNLELFKYKTLALTFFLGLSEQQRFVNCKYWLSRTS